MIRNSLNILKRFNINNNIGSSISSKSFTSNILLTTSHKFINKSSNDNRIIDTISFNKNNIIKNYNGSSSSLKIINNLNSNNNNSISKNNNRGYCSKLPPPLQGNGPIVVRSRKEALTIYFTMLFAIALLGVLYYIWYLKFKRLENAVKSLDELENLSEEDIKKIVQNEKQRKQKESEQVKDDAPVDRILK